MLGQGRIQGWGAEVPQKFQENTNFPLKYAVFIGMLVEANNIF